MTEFLMVYAFALGLMILLAIVGELLVKGI